MSGTLGTFLIGGLLIITVADAPNWRLRPYVGVVGVAVLLSFAENVQPDLAKGFGSLILIGLLLQRGEQLADRTGKIFGST